MLQPNGDNTVHIVHNSISCKRHGFPFPYILRTNKYSHCTVVHSQDILR